MVQYSKYQRYDFELFPVSLILILPSSDWLAAFHLEQLQAILLVAV
jgi:hypothetical protein